MARETTTDVPVDAPVDAPVEPPAPAAYTIDQLSQHTGVPGRTIRFYQSQGVLPPPRRRGRLAFYDDDHAVRLHLIADLRDKGLRLDAIRDALEQLESGSDSLHRWLGLSERGVVADLEGIGLIRRESTGVRPTCLVQSITLVDDLPRLERVGVDLSISVQAAQKIRQAMSMLVDDLVADFVAHFRNDPSAGGPGGPGAPSRAVSAIEQLRGTFGEEVDRAIRSRVQGGPEAIDEMVDRRTPRGAATTTPT